MVSFILPGNSATGGYEVANSVRLDGSSAYMHKTPGSEGNKRTWTFSTWYKKGSKAVAGNDGRWIAVGADSNNRDFIYHGTTNMIGYMSRRSGSSEFDVYTNNNVHRDVSAWYHLVVAVDTTQGTAANRVKLYLNNVQLTTDNVLSGSSSYPDQNYDTSFNDDVKHYLARDVPDESYFDGYLAETVLIDGLQLTPSSFGEFDEDSPTIWKPKDVSGLTFGTNGFYLDYEDSSNLGNDKSGGTDFTEVNLAATDQSTDTCTNNYATLNPLHFNATIPSANTLSEGNLVFTSSQGSSAYPGFYSTIAVSQGKWYAEFKATTADGSTLGIGEGIPSGGFLGGSTNDGVIFHNGNFYTNGSGASTGYDAWSDGDILGVALDLDNNKVYFHKNNTYMASGNPAGNSGGEAITAAASTNSGVYHFCAGDASSGTPAIQCNFGSPPFAISSGNSDANGYGNFEYAVPSGYYALNSKNLAEFG